MEDKKKLQRFDVQFKVIVDTTVGVRAETLEQAIAEARTWGVKDIVQFDSDFNDGEVKLIGAYDPRAL